MIENSVKMPVFNTKKYLSVGVDFVLICLCDGKNTYI